MTPRILLLPLAMVVLCAAAAAPIRYDVDGAATTVSAKVAFLGLASKTAQFPRVSGGATLSPDEPETMRLDVTLDARALQAPDTVTLQRLRGERFFWVEKYPTVRFQGSGMRLSDATNGYVDGMLTARGVTRPVRLDVSFASPPADARAGDPLRLTGSTTIDRRDFGMTSYSLIVGRKVDIVIKATMVPR